MQTMTTITVPFDAEKLSALRQFAERKGVAIEGELAECADKLYVKLVPTAVREYIENKPPTSRPTARPRQPAVNEAVNGDA
jgi:hypothetical protein